MAELAELAYRDPSRTVEGWAADLLSRNHAVAPLRPRAGPCPLRLRFVERGARDTASPVLIEVPVDDVGGCPARLRGEDVRRVLEPGQFRFAVGRSSADLREEEIVSLQGEVLGHPTRSVATRAHVCGGKAVSR